METETLEEVKIDTSTSEEVGIVYRTKDYSIFKTHEMNRDIDLKHLKKLRKSMEENGWNLDSIVVVNEKGEMIDGHHRVIGAQNTGEYVYYTIIEDAPVDSIWESNMLKKNWRHYDHAKRFIKEGNPHYIALEKFENEYPEFSHTDAAMILSNKSSSVQEELFVKGKLTFTDEQIKTGYEWAERLRMFSDHLGGKAYSSGAFVRSMIRVFAMPKERFDFDTFMKNFKKKPGLLVVVENKRAYSIAIENIYNYKRKIPLSLRMK